MSGAVTTKDQIPAKRPEALRIWGKESSINVRKVLWTCDEIGIDYEREDWGMVSARLQRLTFWR